MKDVCSTEVIDFSTSMNTPPPSIMTVNFRSIKDKRAEFETALLYLKPDIICATESRLKGVKPGVNPTIDAIKSCEIFPDSRVMFKSEIGSYMFVNSNS
jgi:hypothetical protein